MYIASEKPSKLWRNIVLHILSIFGSNNLVMYVLSPGNCIKLFENVPFSIYIYNFGFRFGLTVMYLFAIQYFTRLGAKMSMKLINCENYENNEKRADSLVYKVNGPCLFIVLIISWL